MRLACFFFNDTATTEIYTLSLHDALPIWCRLPPPSTPALIAGSGPSLGLLGQDGGHRDVDVEQGPDDGAVAEPRQHAPADRKSTRLNSSHANISYAVFCLKKNNSEIPAVL